MLPVLAPSIQEQVVHVIQKLTKKPLAKVKPTAHLFRDLGLDMLQVVEIIWKLEKRFKREIPDSLPLQTVNDFIRFLATPQQ